MVLGDCTWEDCKHDNDYYKIIIKYLSKEICDLQSGQRNDVGKNLYTVHSTFISGGRFLNVIHFVHFNEFNEKKCERFSCPLLCFVLKYFLFCFICVCVLFEVKSE